jgi:hypothetical protein
VRGEVCPAVSMYFADSKVRFTATADAQAAAAVGAAAALARKVLPTAADVLCSLAVPATAGCSAGGGGGSATGPGSGASVLVRDGVAILQLPRAGGTAGPSPRTATQIAAGAAHCVALAADGTAFSWGRCGGVVEGPACSSAVAGGGGKACADLVAAAGGGAVWEPSPLRQNGKSFRWIGAGGGMTFALPTSTTVGSPGSDGSARQQLACTAVSDGDKLVVLAKPPARLGGASPAAAPAHTLSVMEWRFSIRNGECEKLTGGPFGSNPLCCDPQGLLASRKPRATTPAVAVAAATAAAAAAGVAAGELAPCVFDASIGAMFTVGMGESSGAGGDADAAGLLVCRFEEDSKPGVGSDGVVRARAAAAVSAAAAFDPAEDAVPTGAGGCQGGAAGTALTAAIADADLGDYDEPSLLDLCQADADDGCGGHRGVAMAPTAGYIMPYYIGGGDPWALKVPGRKPLCMQKDWLTVGLPEFADTAGLRDGAQMPVAQAGMLLLGLVGVVHNRVFPRALPHLRTLPQPGAALAYPLPHAAAQVANGVGRKGRKGKEKDGQGGSDSGGDGDESDDESDEADEAEVKRGVYFQPKASSFTGELPLAAAAAVEADFAVEKKMPVHELARHGRQCSGWSVANEWDTLNMKVSRKVALVAVGMYGTSRVDSTIKGTLMITEATPAGVPKFSRTALDEMRKAKGKVLADVAFALPGTAECKTHKVMLKSPITLLPGTPYRLAVGFDPEIGGGAFGGGHHNST